METVQKYIVDFLEKLINKTEQFEVLWKIESNRDLLAFPEIRVCAIQLDQNGDDLFSSVTEGFCYESLFHPGKTVTIDGTVLSTEMNDNNSIYLFPISFEVPTEGPVKEYELYLKGVSKVSPICHSTWNMDTPYNDLLGDLAFVAEVTTRVPIIGPDVQDVIDEFMMIDDLPF